MTIKNQRFVPAIIHFVCFAGVMCYPVLKSESTIYNDMMNSTQMCNSLRGFLSSVTVGVSTSCNITLTQDNESFPEEKIKELLCNGIYDASLKVCQAFSKSEMNTLNFLRGDAIASQWDKEKKILAQELKTGNITYCREIATNLINSHETLERPIQILKDELNEPPGCIRFCTDTTDKPRLLCIALHSLYDYINKIKPNPITGEKINVQNINSLPSNVGSDNILEKKEKEPLKNAETSTLLNKSEAKPKKNSQVAKQSEIKDEDNKQKKTKTTEMEVKQTKTIMEKKTKVVISTTEIPIKQEVPKQEEPNQEVPPKNEIALCNSEECKIKEEEKIDKEKTGKETEIKPLQQEDTYDKSVVDKPEEDQSNVGDYEGDKNILDDDEIHIKDEKEKNDQNQLAHLYQNGEVDADSSHIFLYFMMMSLGFIVLYVMYLSKQKILATFAKMRRSRNRNRRRPSTANYRKLDCTLEEAVTSQCNANVTHVIY